MTLEEQLEQMQVEVSHTEEKQRLLEGLSSRTAIILTKYKAFIAGGAITSVFSNKPITDYDIFFRDEESFKACFETFQAWSGIYCKTVNAITFKDFDGTKSTIQLIKLDDTFKANPEDIFNDFDFSVCCGLYDFTTGTFKLHRDFLKHVAQRKLVFNIQHRFPISSFLRSTKYKMRGYTLDQNELLKIIITIGSLNIKTNADAAKQFQGMYIGENRFEFEKMLDDKTPFDMNKFLTLLSDSSESPRFGAPRPSIKVEVEELPF